MLQLGQLHIQVLAARRLRAAPASVAAAASCSSSSSSTGSRRASSFFRNDEAPATNPYYELCIGNQRKRGRTAENTLNPAWGRGAISSFDVHVPRDLLGDAGGPEATPVDLNEVKKNKYCAGDTPVKKSEVQQCLSLNITVLHDSSAAGAGVGSSATSGIPQVLGLARVPFDDIVTGLATDGYHRDEWVKLEDPSGVHQDVGEIRIIIDFDHQPPIPFGRAVRILDLCPARDIWPLELDCEYHVEGSSHAGVHIGWVSPEGWKLTATVGRALLHPVEVPPRSDLLTDVADACSRVLASPAADTLDQAVGRIVAGGIPALFQEMGSAWCGSIDLAQRWGSGGLEGLPEVHTEIMRAFGFPPSCDGEGSPPADTTEPAHLECDPNISCEEEKALENATPPVTDVCCPITGCPMHCPVVASDGHTYEKKAILRWFEDHDTSPITGGTLATKELFPNYSLSRET